MEKTIRRKRIAVIIGMVLFAFISALILYIYRTRIITVILEPQTVRDWVSELGFFARLIFVSLIVLQVIIAIIPGEPFELAAGYAFGAIEGTLLSVFAITLGSIIVFLTVRKYGMKIVKLFFTEEKINSLSFLKTNKKRTIIYFIIFMIPGTPKDLLCYYAGLTDMKLSMWIIMSLIARLPSVITSAMGGDLLGDKNYIKAVVVFGITLILCVLGIFLYYKFTDKNKEGKNGN